MEYDPNFWGNIAGAVVIGGYSSMRVVNYFKVKNGNGKAAKPPDLEPQVNQNTKDIDEVKHSINDDIFPTINNTATDVAFIKGKIEGRWGKGNDD